MYKVKTGILQIDGKAVTQIASPYGPDGYRGAGPVGLIMHYTAGRSGRSSARYFASNADQVSAHFVVERDGTIIQCRRTMAAAHHAGRSVYNGLSGLNHHTIGIEIANLGFSTSEVPGWIKSGHKNAPAWAVWWEPYPDEQLRAVIDLSRAVRAAHPTIKWVAGHDDVAPGRKTDPGPAFPFQRIKDAIFADGAVDGDNTVTVRSDSGLNLRKGPGVEHDVIKLLPKGTVLSLLGGTSPWLQVSEPVSALSGWLNARFVD